MHARFRPAAALAPLAVASGSKRRAWSATEWGGLPGGRARFSGQRPPLGEPGPRGSEGGGAAAAHWLPTRPPSTGAAAEMIVLGEDFRQGCRAMIVLGGCTVEEDFCRLGSRAASVPRVCVGSGWGGSDACVALLPSGRTAGPVRGCRSL